MIQPICLNLGSGNEVCHITSVFKVVLYSEYCMVYVRNLAQSEYTVRYTNQSGTNYINNLKVRKIKLFFLMNSNIQYGNGMFHANI